MVTWEVKLCCKEVCKWGERQLLVLRQIGYSQVYDWSVHWSDPLSAYILEATHSNPDEGKTMPRQNCP